MIDVAIHDSQTRLSLAPADCRRLVRDVLKAHDVRDAVISLALVDDPTIHRVNREFLQHDYPTDVVTFPYSSPGQPLHGEIIVSTDHAAKQGPRFGHTPEREAMLYIVHGLLHLLGFDDHDPAEARRMKRRQREILDQFAPTPARSAARKKPATTARRKLS